MKIFITQWALTEGIMEREATATQWPRMVSCRPFPNKLLTFFRKPYWHETREEAVAQAERMRQSTIRSLRRRLAKLEAMTF